MNPNFSCLCASASDPRTRFVVYLVSLALSLAALSILKLHKLLEWLLLVSYLDFML